MADKTASARTLWLRVALIAAAIAAFADAMSYATANEATPQQVVFCVCLALGCALLLTFATRRMAVALLTTSVLALLLQTIALLKMQYLNLPLFAPDLFYYSNGNTLEVIEHYPEISQEIIGRLLFALGLIGLCGFCEPPLWRRMRWPRRLLVQLFGIFASVAAIWGVSRPAGPFKEIHAPGPWESITSTSPLTAFVLSAYRMHVSLPAPDPQLADRYDWGAAASPEKSADPTPHRVLPDIVVVLEESTFDPTILDACTIPQCTSPLFAADANTAAHGPLHVHTFGGGTWTSEFALFTGLPTTLFGDGGFYAPFNLAPRVRFALPRLLKQRGYRNIAVYPMPATFGDARRAYMDYGFDEFHDSSEFHLTWTSPDSAIEGELEKIYAKARAENDQPLFVMLLTMRQHGPHNESLATLAPPFDKPLFPHLDAKANVHLGNYLSRMTGSLEALNRLQATLFASGRPAILVHFGDHQPSFDGQMWQLPNTAAAEKLGDPRGTTYYMIRSNLADASKHDYPVLDIGFLAGLILDTADIPKSPFFTANTAMRQRCDGRYLDCADKTLLDSYLSFVFTRLRAIAN